MENDILANIAASAAGLVPVLYTLFIAAALDTLTGMYAAWKSETFNSEFIPTFIMSHIVTRIAPIVLVLVTGVSVGGTSAEAGVALVALGAASGAAYLASVVGSISSNLREGSVGNKGVPTSVALNNPAGAEAVTEPAPPAVVSTEVSVAADAAEDRV